MHQLEKRRLQKRWNTQSLKTGECQLIKDYPMFKFGGSNHFEAKDVGILSG